MIEKLSPDTVAKPVSAYAHAAVIPAGARTLHISGQLGRAPDGRLGDGAAEQLDLAFRNILAIVAAAGMSPMDLAKISVFLTDKSQIADFREARDRLLPKVACASTMIIVNALATPQFLVEIEAIAAVV
jgi:2-iminobutanoate/2-iminopropanoate deaminase